MSRKERVLKKINKKLTTLVKYILFLAVFVIVTMLLSIVLYVKFMKIEKQQIDTLNSINDLRQEIKDLQQNQVKEEKKEIQDSTVEAVAKVCIAESADLQGQMAVAEVVKNRAEMWDMTFEEVIGEPYQFAEPRECEVPHNIMYSVRRVLEGKSLHFGEDKATHFVADWMEDKPSWTENKKDLGVVGGNRFYG